MSASLLWLLCAWICWLTAYAIRWRKAAHQWRHDALEQIEVSRFWRERSQWLRRELQDERKRKQEGVYR